MTAGPCPIIGQCAKPCPDEASCVQVDHAIKLARRTIPGPPPTLQDPKHVSWSPLGARRPRVRISQHSIRRALHIAAWGSHVCQSLPMKGAPTE